MTISAPLHVDITYRGGTDGWYEPAAAASQINENELLIMAYGGTYAITNDAGASFTGGWHFHVNDPFAACARGSGRIFAGGHSANPSLIFYTYRDPGGSTLAGQPTFSQFQVQDRPSLAIGPAPGDPSTLRYYFTYNQPLLQPGGPAHLTCRAGATGPIHASATDTPLVATPNPWSTVQLKPEPSIGFPCDYEGWGAAAVVCNNGTIVVATADAISHADGTGLYNNRRPYILFSLDGGQTWNPQSYPPIRLAGDPPINVARRYYGASTDPGDTPYGIDKRTNSPSIAVDRSVEPNIVYVAFYGRAAGVEGLDTDDRNADIYIFRGTNNGTSWGNLPGQHFIQITDAALGIPEEQITEVGPDQAAPALAVDCSGALCLTFYDNRHDTAAPAYQNKKVDVYFLRLAWPSAGPWSVLTQARLTQHTFPIPGSTGNAGAALSDFYHLPVAGESQRRLYPVYIAREPDGSGGWTQRRLFTHRVTVNLCPSGPMGMLFEPEHHADELVGYIVDTDPRGDLNADDWTDLDDLELLEYWLSNPDARAAR
ncbi:MAG: hypothetical protein HRU70_13350 [Phycisphaeraceae bacterium]|nr:MAG: hypothetical protein HRU70_13350 [Phycisphaeraceae bacterium]